MRRQFSGHILGVGSTSGTRVVVGRWLSSPFGSFADVMIEHADGHRRLLAPTSQVADFVAQTYTFDEVEETPVEVQVVGDQWRVRAAPLRLTATIGQRTAVGWLLRGIPRPIASSTAWASMVDPVARVALRGVRTRGTARVGRREWYAATDVRAVTRLIGRLDGHDLGRLADVDPPCRFGFSSTPRRPSVTDVVTTVEINTALD